MCHEQYDANPSTYKLGYGCPHCAKCSPEKAAKDFYDLVAQRGDICKDEYKTSTTKLHITCNKCNHTNYVTPTCYKNNNGCAWCANKSPEKAAKEFYDLVAQRGDLVIGEYKTKNIKIKIECGKCNHIFNMSAGNYKNGSGCPHCAPCGGFRTNKTGYLYIMYDDENCTMKIGITNTPQKRHKQVINAYNEHQQANAVFLKQYKHQDGQKIYDCEQFIHKQFINCGLTGFSGASEWFKYDPRVFEMIEQFLYN